MKLHPLQKQLLELSADNALEGMSLREIGSLVGIDHPQKVKHHFQQLEKKGYIKINPNNGNVEFLRDEIKDIIYLPLYGMAECGPMGFLAESNHTENIPLPTSIFGVYSPQNLFLVRANGNSMLPKIQEGDLVVVEKKEEIANDTVSLVMVNEVPMIKQFMRIDDETIALKSFNTDFKTQILREKDHQVNILGAVKQVISRF